MCFLLAVLITVAVGLFLLIRGIAKNIEDHEDWNA